MSTLISTKFCAWCTFVFVTTTYFVKLGVWCSNLRELALVCSKCIAWFASGAPILPIVINPSYQITAFVQSFHQPKMFKMNETIQPMTINTNFRSVMRINPPKITIKNPNKNISISILFLWLRLPPYGRISCFPIAEANVLNFLNPWASISFNDVERITLISYFPSNTADNKRVMLSNLLNGLWVVPSSFVRII